MSLDYCTFHIATRKELGEPIHSSTYSFKYMVWSLNKGPVV